MPCCAGHTCDRCATCQLGVCCGDSGGKTQEPRGVPVGEPHRRPSETPVEAPAKPGSVPVGALLQRREREPGAPVRGQTFGPVSIARWMSEDRPERTTQGPRP